MKQFIILLCGLAVLGSCRKYNSLGFTPGKGAPTVTSVHTWNKTDTALRYDTIVTYNSAGDTTLKVNVLSGNAYAFDSVTTAGNPGQYYMIYGANLGSTVTVAFNGTSAYFNRALMTDGSLLVSIPQNTPTSGPQATDTLTITTLYGVVRYHFIVIPPPPTVNSVSDYDFWSGSQITLKGVGFSTVTSVGLSGSSDQATIVDQSDTVMTLSFGASAVNRCNLVFSYSSAGTPATAVSSQEFVDMDNAYQIVFNSNFQNTWFDNSWTHPSGITSGQAHAYGGTASAQLNYPAGAWQIEGWACWNAPSGGFPYDPSYKYLTFWVKGGTVNHTLVLVGDKLPGGYSQNTSAAAIQQIATTAGTWTYYKIPLGTGAGQLNYWATGTLAQQLGFFLQGQSGDVNELMYIDECAFVK